MTQTILLLTWFGTLLHAAPDGALRHGPVGSSPRNLACATARGARLIAADAVPGPRLRVTRHPELHTIGLVAGPAGSGRSQLRALPGGGTDQDGAPLDSWAGFLEIGTAELDLVAAVLASGWQGPGPGLPWPAAIGDGFALRIGPLEVDLAGPVFPILAHRRAGAERRALPRRIALIRDARPEIELTRTPESPA